MTLAGEAQPATEPTPVHTRGDSSGTECKLSALVLALIVAFGVTLRLAEFLRNRSLWIDEAWVALNVLTRSYGELVGRLDYEQSAPALFLWMQKVATELVGPSEYALRAPALLAGLALVPMSYLVAHRVLAPRAALFAAALVGVSPTLVYFSSEAKPYGVDAFVGIALVAATLRWKRRIDDSGRRAEAMVCGVVAVWLSAPAVFVLAAAIIALFSQADVHDHRRRARAVLACAVLWALSFTAAYLVMYRHASGSAYMRRYWSESLLVGSGWEFFQRLWWALGEVFWRGLLGNSPGYSLLGLSPVVGHFTIAVVVLFAVLGTVRLARTNDVGTSVLVAGPLVIAYGASVVGAYPVAIRLMLFTLPLVALLVAAGVESMARGQCRYRVVRRSMNGIAAGLIFVAIVIAVLKLFVPPVEHVRPLVGEFRRLRHAGEAIYVSSCTLPAWLYYTTDWSAGDTSRIARYRRIAGLGGPAYCNNSAGQSREWMALLEDDLLVSVQHDGLRELMGLGTGIEYREYVQWETSTPDPVWVEREARRLAHWAAPGVWLLFSHVRPPTECALIWRLSQAGARLTYERLGNRAALFRYEFGQGTQSRPTVPTDLWDDADSAVPHDPEWLRTCPFVPAHGRSEAI